MTAMEASREARIAQLKAKRAASMHLGKPAPSYVERVAAIDRAIEAALNELGMEKARLEAEDDATV
jgi:hypothetical protein